MKDAVISVLSINVEISFINEILTQADMLSIHPITIPEF
jgi:hypothetical protein